MADDLGNPYDVDAQNAVVRRIKEAMAKDERIIVVHPDHEEIIAELRRNTEMEVWENKYAPKGYVYIIDPAALDRALTPPWEWGD